MIIRFVFLAAVVFYAAPSVAVTADDLRAVTDEKTREDVRRQNRAKSDALESLLPNKEQQSQPQSQKYGKTQPKPEEPKRRRVSEKRRSAPVSPKGVSAENPNIYIPPPRNASGSSSELTTDAVKVKHFFGIRLGSWLHARLDRNTTSAETGTVELILDEDYAGDRRTLPAGTMLFAVKTLNSQTKRMEMAVTHGITPSGLEFAMTGLVFDPNKVPGLAGVYVMNKKEVASQGIQKGLLAGMGAAITQAAPGPLGVATTTASEDVLKNAGQVTENNAPQAVIYVSPQALIIRVEKQF